MYIAACNALRWGCRKSLIPPLILSANSFNIVRKLLETAGHLIRMAGVVVSPFHFISHIGDVAVEFFLALDYAGTASRATSSHPKPVRTVFTISSWLN